MTDPDDPTSTKSSSTISSQILCSKYVTHAWSSLYIFTWTVWLCNLKFEGFPLLYKSAQTIFMHANTRLDKVLDSLVVIVLVFGVPAMVLSFGVLAKSSWTTRSSSDKMMKAMRSGKASDWISRPHSETQLKDQTPLSDTTSRDSSVRET